MKRKITNIGLGIIGIALIVLNYAISWLATCGIVYLITLCFGWSFKWSLATGIWLIIIILKSIFQITIKNK